MKTDIASEYFTAVVPSEKVLNRDREFLSKRAAAEFKRRAEIDKARRETQALYNGAFTEMLTKQGNLKVPATRGATAAGKQRRAEQPGKAEPLLVRPRNLISVTSPYVGWVDLYPTGATPGNDAGASGSFDGRNSISLDVAAGQNELQGGSASAYGYIGQYFSASGVQPSGLFGTGTVSISANPWVSCNPVWTTTNIWPFTWDTAVLTTYVNIWYPIYDADWNFLGAVSSPQVSIYDVSSAGGSYGIVVPDPFAQNYALSTSYGILPTWNIGVFVQLYAYASGAGASTGSWVPGSEASVGLTMIVDSIEVNGPVVEL
jgi:hypothetical protein